MQVGPFRWNQRPASVGEHHYQVQSALPVPGPKNSKRLTLERMVWSSDLDVFGGVVEVGSVCDLRSTIRISPLFTTSKKQTVLATSCSNLSRAKRFRIGLLVDRFRSRKLSISRR